MTMSIGISKRSGFRDPRKCHRRTLALCMCVTMLFMSMLSGCAQKTAEDGVTDIVCTVFPQYDWIKRLVGDDSTFRVSLLVDNGSDIHSYQPTVADRVEIAECDMLVSVGLSSDLWVEEMLGDSDASVVRLSQISGVTLRRAENDGIVSEHVHDEHDEHGEHGEHDEHDGHDHD